MARITYDLATDAPSREERNRKRLNRDYLNTLIPYLAVCGVLVTATLFCTYKGCERGQQADEQKRIENNRRESEKEGLKDKIQTTEGIKR